MVNDKPSDTSDTDATLRMSAVSALDALVVVDAVLGDEGPPMGFDEPTGDPDELLTCPETSPAVPPEPEPGEESWPQRVVPGVSMGSWPPSPDHPGAHVWVDYVNWRGDRRWREIVPARVTYGVTRHHEVPQWFLIAWDVGAEAGAGAERSFALGDVMGWSRAKPDWPSFSESSGVDDPEGEPVPIAQTAPVAPTAQTAPVAPIGLETSDLADPVPRVLPGGREQGAEDREPREPWEPGFGRRESER